MDNEKDIKKENSAMEKVENAALTNEVAPPAKKNKTAHRRMEIWYYGQIYSYRGA